MAEPLLRVENLKVEFSTEDGIVHAVDGITYQVMPGRTLGIVGESGSGKTVASLTTLGLTRGRSTRISGRILFGGRDLATLPDSELRAIRGNEIAMIFQDPLSSLHPLYRVGSQLAEAVLAHQQVSRASARAGRGAARPRRHSRSVAPGRRLPARVLSRHPPARADR